MKLIAVETSAEACSVALWLDGQIYAREVVAANRHTEFVLPLLDELRAEAQLTLNDLDGVAFGAGPGAFTGVRIAASIAHGIALACDCPLLPISSLAALALGGWRATGISTQLALLDARRGEVYWGLYSVPEIPDQIIALSADSIHAPHLIPVPAASEWGAVGYGWEVYAAQLLTRLQPSAIAECRFPSAVDVARLAITELRAGRGRAAPEALPVYLRAPL
jgi:tRNA threonylcarbamoyladenosine biosynthesis protein TsaB